MLKRTEKCCLKRQLAGNAFVFHNPWLADGRTSGVITGATNLNTTCKRWRTSVLEETILTCRLPAKVWKKRQKLKKSLWFSYLGRQNAALLGWTTDFCHFDSHWTPAALSLKKVHTQRKTLKRFRSHNETGVNWSWIRLLMQAQRGQLPLPKCPHGVRVWISAEDSVAGWRPQEGSSCNEHCNILQQFEYDSNDSLEQKLATLEI